jgi:hypothetical protein
MRSAAGTETYTLYRRGIELLEDGDFRKQDHPGIAAYGIHQQSACLLGINSSTHPAGKF